MFFKVHENGKKKIIAICDSELLNKKFEEEGLQLDVNERFFKGESLEKRDLIMSIKNILDNEDISSFNAIGEDSTELLLEFGLIEKESILKIAKIPYAIIVF